MGIEGYGQRSQQSKAKGMCLKEGGRASIVPVRHSFESREESMLCLLLLLLLLLLSLRLLGVDDELANADGASSEVLASHGDRSSSGLGRSKGDDARALALSIGVGVGVSAKHSSGGGEELLEVHPVGSVRQLYRFPMQSCSVSF